MFGVIACDAGAVCVGVWVELAEAIVVGFDVVPSMPHVSRLRALLHVVGFHYQLFKHLAFFCSITISMFSKSAVCKAQIVQFSK